MNNSKAWDICKRLRISLMLVQGNKADGPRRGADWSWTQLRETFEGLEGEWVRYNAITCGIRLIMF